ncbi:hypothetical protein [Hallella multisaccharivorax]|uniref:hypothetical protein n=1 Tax=Hallella multisaccharivorax TaxID=310514 RepID=UPI00361F598E
MKRILLLSLLALMCCVSVYPKPVVLRRSGLFQRGGMRMPSATRVKVDYDDVFFAKASKIAEEMKKVFDIEIKSNVYGRYNPQILDPLCETITVDFNNMHWFGNSNLNLKFIYNKESKIAFTVYEDDLEGDYVLDEYGLRDWFDANCTYKNISLGTVTRTFKIIGL